MKDTCHKAAVLLANNISRSISLKFFDLFFFLNKAKGFIYIYGESKLSKLRLRF